MTIEGLDQALAQAKLGDAEVDGVDIIARLLELPRAAVIRVLFARRVFKEQHLGLLPENVDAEIPEEVRTALRAEIRRGSLRVLTADAISAGQPMYTHVKTLIKRKNDVCRGCPFSMQCVVKSYSTPAECYSRGVPQQIREQEDVLKTPQVMRFSRGGAMVYPTRIRGDVVSVTSSHPRGTYDVDVGELWK
jgi:hypothetical protein